MSHKLVDCDAGRRLGCQTFCCRLVVRLSAEERARGVPGVEPPMGCVPKREDGDCVHFDPSTKRCNIWNERPQVCRGYDCNNDELLQVVLTRGFTTLKELVTARPPPRSSGKIVVPHLGHED